MTVPLVVLIVLQFAAYVRMLWRGIVLSVKKFVNYAPKFVIGVPNNAKRMIWNIVKNVQKLAVVVRSHAAQWHHKP